jgi:spermidine/putrescine transport system substrate-binding protein
LIPHWEAVFGDKHAGRISWRAGGLPLVVPYYLGTSDAWTTFDGSPEAVAKLEESFKGVQTYVSEHKKNILKWYETAAEAQQLFYGDEIDISQGLPDVVMPLVVEDPDYGRSIPEEGTYGFTANYSITKGAPHEDNAYKFVNFLLSQPDANGAMIRSAGGASTMFDNTAGLSATEAKAYAFSDEELARIDMLSVLGVDDPRFPMLDKVVSTLKEA